MWKTTWRAKLVHGDFFLNSDISQLMRCKQILFIIRKTRRQEGYGGHGNTHELEGDVIYRSYLLLHNHPEPYFHRNFEEKKTQDKIHKMGD